MILREGRIFYLGEEVGQEDENEGDVQEGDKIEEDAQVEEENEDAWPQDGEFEVPNFVVRRAMV